MATNGLLLMDDSGNVTLTNDARTHIKALARTLGLTSSESAEPIQTKDRFAGALLGLNLVSPICASNSAAEPSLIQALRNEVCLYFQNTEAFLAGGFTRYINSTRPTSLSQLYPYLLPICLRYPGESLKVLTVLADCEPFLVANALVFGDAIALAMSGYGHPSAQPVSKNGLLQAFHSRNLDQNIPPAVSHRYIELWTAITSAPDWPARCLPTDKSAYHKSAYQPLIAAEFTSAQPLIIGILSAMKHPQNHSLAVRYACASMATSSVSSHCCAPAIAGILSGAAGSTATLSVLWQVACRQITWRQIEWPIELTARATSRFLEMRSLPSRQQVLSLSDRLFYQWAGIYPEPSQTQPLEVTINPKS
ncbi:MAG: hypothetical protein AAGL08_16140 [Cyanobacteria bacterium J06573_11]